MIIEELPRFPLAQLPTPLESLPRLARELGGKLERDAIRLMARCEGIILDPIYAGRAFRASVDLIRKGVFQREETVLFWHTGGGPATFAYAKDLSQATRC